MTGLCNYWTDKNKNDTQLCIIQHRVSDVLSKFIARKKLHQLSQNRRA